MEAIPSDERIDGVQPRVSKESHPQVKIFDIPVSGVQFAAGFFPQAPASER